jgi:uncharacterized protein YecE (DUF72 family)
MAEVFFGTSGFDYAEWKPDFYPPDVPRKDFLRYYAGKFNTVELNNTFYRIPNPAKIVAWASATPQGFRFSLKAPRTITHMWRLKLPSEPLHYLLRAVEGFRDRAGPILFQLPPFFKCDTARLAAFLNELPRSLMIAFEFRHESWFQEEVYRILQDHSAGLCIHDADETVTPVRLTASFAYLRLRRAHYPRDLRDQWLNRIHGWVLEGIDVFAYIKHEDNPDAPRIAHEFAEGCPPGRARTL